LLLGIAAVAITAGLCAFAFWSVRGRLPAASVPVAVAPAPDLGLQAENRRLRSELARVTAERDAALARAPSAEVPPPLEPPAPAPAAPVHLKRGPAPAQAPASGVFTEPQTFESSSTGQ
jgi:hypothetical protein